MTSEDDLRLPPLGLFGRYLESHGWRRSRLPRGDLDLFTSEAGKGGIEIVLPVRPSPLQAERMVPALKTLATTTGRDIRVLAAEIRMLDFDILRARLPDSAVLRDSIRLRVAEKFIGNTRRFLTSAAAAELKRTLVVDESQKAAIDYAEACRFGHTFHGSFGFTIESEAGPGLDPTDNASSPPPFARRVVERVAKGLATLERAVRSGNSDLLETDAASGMNVNMMEDFTTLLAETSAGKINFDIALTPAWAPSAGLPLAAEISQDALPLIDRAVKALRPPESRSRETIIGQIVTLHTQASPADLLDEGSREITVDGISVQRGPLSVKLRLTPAEYLLAHELHGAGKMVSVSGVVRRSSRGHSLLEPRDFKGA